MRRSYAFVSQQWVNASALLTVCATFAILCFAPLASANTVDSTATFGSTSVAVTGTLSTSGSSTTVTSSASDFAQSHVGGIIVLTGGGTVLQIRYVNSATQVTVWSAVNIPTPKSYTLYALGFEVTANGLYNGPAAYIGLSSVMNQQLVAPSSQLNLIGPASSTTGLNGYINDNYLGFSIFTYTHDNVFLAFDAGYDGANWVSSDNNGAQRLNKHSGNLNFDTSGAVTVGSNIPGWTTWMQATNAGQVNFPASAGIHVTGVTTLDVPLYVNGGGTGSGTSMSGNKVIGSSSVGTGGGKMVETAFAVPLVVSLGPVTFTYAGGSYTATVKYRNFANVTTVFVSTGSNFTIGGADSFVSAPTGTIPAGIAPSTDQSCKTTTGYCWGCFGYSYILMVMCVGSDGSIGFGYAGGPNIDMPVAKFGAGTSYTISQGSVTYLVA